MSNIEQSISKKLQQLRCPFHGTHPRVSFTHGGSVEINNPCCQKLQKLVEDNLPRIMSEIIQEQIAKGLRL